MKTKYLGRTICTKLMFGFLSSIFILINAAHSAEWYETAGWKKNDPFNINGYHSASSGGNTNRVFGTFKLGYRRVSQGEVYVILSKSDLQKIENKGELSYVHYKNTLDKKEAIFWKKYFAQRSEVERVPLIYSVVGVINVPVGISSVLLDVLLSSSDTTTVTAGVLSELMVEGGEFINYVTMRRDDSNKPYIYSDAFYKIKINGKDRFYLIYSSVHAVKVQ